MVWPVPKSYSKTLPREGEPGSFWEFRGDRYHCGVDIYAAVGETIVAMDDGVILDVGVFTSPQQIEYWNETCFVVVMHASGLFARYAEMDGCLLENEDIIRKGQFLGRVGQVLNPARISSGAPEYIKRLSQSEHASMLHLEMFSRYPAPIPQYLGGNTFQGDKPSFLLDPADYFEKMNSLIAL